VEIAVHLQRGEADVDTVDERRTIAKAQQGQEPETGFSQRGSANWVMGKRCGGLLDYQIAVPRLQNLSGGANFVRDLNARLHCTIHHKEPPLHRGDKWEHGRQFPGA
jgi:hypothetical protein